MQSIMAAIPPLFTPGKGTRSSPRNSLGASSSAGAQDSPRLKKKTPGSARRKSFARKLIDQETTPQKQDEEDSGVNNVSEGVGVSVQLEQDEVASASTPRAPLGSVSATHSIQNAADAAGPSSSQARRVRTGRISEIINREDIGVAEAEEQEYGFKRFFGYRWIGNSIEIQVEWDTGEVTWEPETNLHEDAPDSLFEYWREQGGRPQNPADPEIYEVFAILKHNKNRSRLLVEWVGFEPSEASWASRKIIEETAKDIVDAYFDSLKTTKKMK
nr:chromo(chromatin organization modifier)domain [Trichoderma taxi]